MWLQLGQIALGINSANAKVAYATLAMSCEPRAGDGLDRLAEIDQVRAALVREFPERMQEARRLNCDSVADYNFATRADPSERV
jgi:hypothetical protein